MTTRLDDAELEQRLAAPTCLHCGHDAFQEEVAKMDSRFGASAHTSRLLICRRCGFMMQFSMGRGFTV